MEFVLVNEYIFTHFLLQSQLEAGQLLTYLRLVSLHCFSGMSDYRANEVPVQDLEQYVSCCTNLHA